MLLSSIYTLTFSSRNVTSLNNRFEDLSIEYSAFRLRAYPINEVALGFINAMKIQALENFDEHVISYTYTDTEYEDSPIRIRIVALAGAPPVQLVRGNVMYAIKSLAIEQLSRARLYGATFTESYHGEPLYRGVFDNKSDPPSVEQLSSSSADTSETIAQDKRALSTYSLDARNSTAILLNIPGSDDVHYRMEFDFVGGVLSQVGIFSAILNFMFTLAQRDGADTLQNLSELTSTDSVWIFVTKNWESEHSLQVFQLLAIMESVARHAVLRGLYQEMIFNFFIDEELVAGGCFTAPVLTRVWCGGIREES